VRGARLAVPLFRFPFYSSWAGGRGLKCAFLDFSCPPLLQYRLNPFVSKGMMTPLSEYLKQIEKALQAGDATVHNHYPTLNISQEQVTI
jgi:hypothetical protein